MSAQRTKRPKGSRAAGSPLQRALRFVTELMAIPGKSGEEADVADYVRRHVIEAGLAASAIEHDTAHRRTRLPGQIGNLIIKLPGTQRAPRRLLTAHLDTVPICVGSVPVRDGERMRSKNPATGLGADNRAGTAVLLVTLLELLERKLPHPPLTFCWFVQEEIGLEGSRHVSKTQLGRPALAFNWDGSSPYKITIGATSGYRFEISIEGIASHAGVAPEKGVSAIAIAALAIADLVRGGWHGRVEQDGQRGTSNVGVISGGDATNVVTDRVLVRAEARSHDPQFRERMVQQIEGAFRAAAANLTNIDGKSGQVQIAGRLDYESFLLQPDEPCVQEACAAVESLGRQPELAISNGGLDANWTTRHGIPTVTLGTGQVNAHMTSEALDIPQFEDACRIALRIATAGAAGLD